MLLLRGASQVPFSVSLMGAWISLNKAWTPASFSVLFINQLSAVKTEDFAYIALLSLTLSVTYSLVTALWIDFCFCCCCLFRIVLSSFACFPVFNAECDKDLFFGIQFYGFRQKPFWVLYSFINCHEIHLSAVHSFELLNSSPVHGCTIIRQATSWRTFERFPVWQCSFSPSIGSLLIWDHILYASIS